MNMKKQIHLIAMDYEMAWLCQDENTGDIATFDSQEEAHEVAMKHAQEFKEECLDDGKNIKIWDHGNVVEAWDIDEDVMDYHMKWCIDVN